MNQEDPTVLVIDDDAEIRYSIDRVLTNLGTRVTAAESGETGIEKARTINPDIIFLDNRMGGISGIETLQHLRTAAPQSMVILMTAYGTTQTAIEAMKHGAFDYVLKPFDLKKLESLVAKALQASRDIRESGEKKDNLLNSADYAEGIAGSGEAMQNVLKTVGQVAASEATVMITGESGTGKELIARCVHRHSHRAKGPFVAVNCAAIPENLIESELFGHEKGAFTGATDSKAGQFELSSGGTLFLDEIGDMTLPTQTKILRAIQEGEIQRVGGTKVKKVDVRLLAATHKNLVSMVKAKDFREDLYYRLNVVAIEVPPLRERMEDLPELVDFIIHRLNKEKKTGVKEISKDAFDALCSYDWPGNVRELENALHSASVVNKGKRILRKDLPSLLNTGPSKRPEGDSVQADKNSSSGDRVSPNFGSRIEPKANEADKSESTSETISTSSVTASESFDLAYANIREMSDSNLLAHVEKEMIQRTLIETGGNQVKASALLGITRATLRKRIDAYGIRF
ncbi:sigma-54 dependent transcriptional regulator [Opitutales bacterium]|nr:sigma-54 dependent transcriptional regulator [Opitutales bacterium]